MTEELTVPQNVGLIMDGNGRWGAQHCGSRAEGHTEGIRNMLRLASHAFACGIKTLTCYSLSTENLQRDPSEVGHILSLVLSYFDAFVDTFRKLQVCIRFVGSLELLPEQIRASLRRTEEALQEFAPRGRVLYIAIAYGSRAETVCAVNRAVEAGQRVTEDDFLSMLGLPVSLDFVIRTGGEQRLSNFFLFQCAYAELYFSEKLFPEFSTADLDAAFAAFAARSRRYGR